MTVALSLICIAVRVSYSWLSPMQQRMLVEGLGANPANLPDALPWLGTSWPGTAWAALVGALFIHTSWLHLFGNIAYLWVFGMPVERRLGPSLLAGIFLLGGALANVTLATRLPALDATVIGASGAVSAVVGAYLGLFPFRHIGLYLPLGLFVQFVRLPALLVIGSWFTLQLVYSVFGPISGAMSWWIHLAGFAVGLVIALLVRAVDQIRN